ncbi:tripartite tricarboxylate transporter substrate binding protein [Roseococcus sp. SYP-B2431]|uniref:Bug family tripartite tricarboxylate transporter substrate binding protein n=1 Tax=Roseococcus sp. SYP-B2431 TaxID=2496640 RepID=UPI00103E4619|nr:tripartite tricarboxylate transporter substrate binding protein [Roseococcus sp. SYP-B2431]TCH97366.1 tripartite tricarboxylate transporter substrate binding protein [Roseococcus sp. SYP-B2431]
MRRRHILGASLAFPAIARAQVAYPQRPVRLVVPFAAGGATDILARAVAQSLQAEYGQSFVAENRTGAGGTIGAEAVAKSAPDGHTLLLGTTATQSITPHLYARLSYDAARDFSAVSAVASVPMVLAVHPSLGVTDVAGLVARAKAEPGRITFASSGQGSITHLASELFRARAGVELTHIPYRGSAPAMTDLVAGRVLMMIDHAPTILPQISGGALRALGVAGTEPIAQLPGVAPIGRTLAGFEVSSWFGVLAPAGTPEAIVSQLNASIGKALTQPEVAAKLREQGADPMPGSPDAFASLITRDSRLWGEVVRRAGVTLG